MSIAASYVLREPTQDENPLGNGLVTDWRQCAILCLTPKQITKIRGEASTIKTVSNGLTKARQRLRVEGWQFVEGRNPHKPFIRAVPPKGHEIEVKAAQSAWQAEAARQLRSGWGTRIGAGKKAGN